MKEHIYTIPITDALTDNCGCVLCTIEKKLEEDALCYFLGPSLMEPDGREITNKKGFCKSHLDAMMTRNNRLGLALMLETHLKEIANSLEIKKKGGMFSKESTEKLTADSIYDVTDACAICDKINAQMKAVANNLAYLWGKEDDFKKNFEASNGLCLKHTALAISESSALGGKKKEEYIEKLKNMQKEKLNKLSENVHAFTLSFDYRNAGKKLTDDEVNSVLNSANELNGY